MYCFRLTFLLSAIIMIGLAGCVKDHTPIDVELDAELTTLLSRAAPSGNANYYILPHEDHLNQIPQDPMNPLTAEKVELGKFLFFDTALAQDAKFESGKGTYSCATCHIPEAGFRPGNYQGIADGGVGFGSNGEDRRMNYDDYQASDLDVQSARPLNLINVAYVHNTFWNGQFGATHANADTEHLWDLNHATEGNHTGHMGLEVQNVEGLTAHRIRIDKPTLQEYGYIDLFNDAFPDVADQDTLYTKYYASLAISAYLRTVLGNQAPFQHWLKGNSQAMSTSEKEGAILFFSKANCSRCHYEPNLGSLEFHALGVKDMYQLDYYDAHADDFRNKGRASFTMRDEDLYKFKVPSIYNMSDTEFYFHGASKFSLKELLDYKNLAVSENPNVPNSLLSEKFEPLHLNDTEIQQLEDFLAISIRDPNLTRYKPTSVPSGQCFPNADQASLRDLGCE